jgi:hypothetical protein
MAASSYGFLNKSIRLSHRAQSDRKKGLIPGPGHGILEAITAYTKDRTRTSNQAMTGKMMGQGLVLLAHGAVGWALCGAVIGVGRSVLSMQATLIVHAMAVPIFFGLISALYFSRFRYTGPLATAAFFLVFVVVMDALVVALLIERSFDMFRSPLGTWIPFALIFLSTYSVGRFLSVPKGKESP